MTTRKRKGGAHCSAIACTNGRYKFDCANKSFFKFPREVQRCKKWVQNIRREDLLGKTVDQLRNYVLCSDHFEKSQFLYPDKENKLGWNAVPTIFSIPNPPPRVTSKRPSLKSRPPVTNPGSNKKMRLNVDTDPQTTSTQACADVSEITDRILDGSPDLEVSTVSLISADGIMMQSLETNNLAVPPISMASTSGISVVTMDRPHVCQRCSATFMLASSLRTHAAHIHGEGLQAFLAENGYHPNEDSNSHRDTVGDMTVGIKKEVFEVDSGQSSDLLTDSQTQAVSVKLEKSDGDNCGSGITANNDLKVNVIKTELCDYEMESMQSTALVTDSQAQVSVKLDESDSDIYGTGFDTNSDVMVDRIKTESYDCKMESVQSNALVTDTQAQVTVKLDESDIYGTGFATNSHVMVDMIKTEQCDCKMESVQSNALVTGTQEQVVSERHVNAVSEHNEMNANSQEMDPHEKAPLAQTNSIPVIQTENDLSISQKSSDSSSNLKRQKEIRGGERYHVCNVCEKTFGSSSVLKKHKYTHTGERPYVCTTCKKTFSILHCLKEHERNRHAGDRPYICNVCGKSFTCLSTLNRHARIHPGNRPYGCNVCNKTFATSGDLKTHEQSHTEKPYTCNVCNQSFAKRSVLKSHYKLIHAGGKPYVCKVCEKSFEFPCKLKVHEQIHTGKNPYICNICKKSFNFPSKLKAHERTHTGERPYPCNVCNKNFASSTDLKKHERIHTGDRPFVCKECDKTFTFLSNLNRHKRSHTGVKPFACNVCKKSFATPGDLKIHERIHTGDKPYVCKECGKTFTCVSNLYKHEQINTGKMAYVCKICEATFSLSCGLKEHESIHTGDRSYDCKKKKRNSDQ